MKRTVQKKEIRETRVIDCPELTKSIATDDSFPNIPDEDINKVPQSKHRVEDTLLSYPNQVR